ncbi:fimbrial assembly protein [Terracidiphilus sp.]|jgi:type IV pilus assembly protein PilN|uniref:fimbrial assembly protein n=1 Tax=Terracidiphilus sp. TaxID=1964191 RepID=UPI003C29B143
MRISLNLATRPFADLGPALKRLRIGMAILAVLSGAFWLGIHLLGSKAEAARQRERVLDGAATRLNQERLGYQTQLHQPDNAGVLAQANSLNRLFDEKSFSWTLAMEDLETVLPAGVQVVSLEPVRDKNGTITLHLRVQGPRDHAVTLVQNLEHSRRFVQPRIVNETAETGSGPAERVVPVSAENRVNFDLLADYNPATPEERKAAAKKAAASAGSEQNESKHAPFHAGPGALRPPYAGASHPHPGGQQ